MTVLRRWLCQLGLHAWTASTDSAELSHYETHVCSACDKHRSVFTGHLFGRWHRYGYTYQERECLVCGYKICQEIEEE